MCIYSESVRALLAPPLWSNGQGSIPGATKFSEK
jgi:hypothetical protein